MARGESDHVIVLAGGAGKRMGGAKVLMDVGGRAWWRVQRDRLAATGLEQTWVVSGETRRVFAGEDDAPGRLVLGASGEPMFGSVVRGLASLDTGSYRGVFLQPIDVPVAGVAVWRALAASGRCAVTEHDGKRGHPIYLPREWIETRVLIDHGGIEPRLDALVGRDRVVVRVDDPDVAVNLNTPEDVAAWLAARG